MFKSIIYLLLVLLIICVEEFYPQISPGDLTKAHAHLEGLSNCTKCHQLGKQVLNSKCLDCHTQINHLVNSNRGYHSSSEVKGKDCRNCHSEHHGRNFRIINFNPDNFDHSKTGFILTGSHKNIDCSKCHRSSFVTDPDIKKKSFTYLGLNTQCKSCHEDYHQSTLGNNCSDCHNTDKFRPASLFDHNKSGYMLTGRHLNVDCISCHTKETRNGKEFQKFRDLNFSSCSSCHQDVHKGSFGINCQSCHTTAGFKIINESAFNHSRTNFPLIGKHEFVKCSDCHKGSLSVKPAFAKCTDCHADYHKGELISVTSDRDCRDCHTEHGFSPSLYSIKEHNQAAFKITGSHLAVPCKSCHGKDEQWHFRNIGMTCVDCHNNVHGSELTEKYLPENNCESCHNTDKWTTILFDHKQTSFELLGRHKSLSCFQCHVTRDDVNKISYRFASLESNCEVCHKDIHFGQFRADDIIDCTNCHTFDNWKPERFDHGKTKFSLDGAHSKLDCISCHKPVTKNGNTFTQYRLEDFRCASCHS